MPKRRKILYAVLNWGLGHATRSLPLIRKLKEDNDITVLSTGRSLNLLRSELPDINFIDHPDYSVKYTKRGRSLLLSIILQIPGILIRLREEHKHTEKLVDTYGFDRIVSDNRYGIYSRVIPSFFITHQLRFKLPKGLGKLEIFSEIFNKFYFRKYRKIFIPDEKNQPNLSGNLSHNIPGINPAKLCYTGILADINDTQDAIPSDILIIVSGPEPQRSIFESKVIEQSQYLKGKIIIVCGKPESSITQNRDNVKIYSHASRNDISKMIRGAELIVSRPGYSSVMEIVSVGKRAVFIPTPGQTEQEYLASYYMEKRYFYSVTQSDMDLKKDIRSAIQSEYPDIRPNRIGGVIEKILS